MSAEAQTLTEEDDLQGQLRAHYLGGAAGRLAAVDRVLAAYRADPYGEEAGQALFRQLHTLAGSAGTYGFKEISADARILEKAVKQALEVGAVPSTLLEKVEEFRRGMAAQFVAAGATLETAQTAPSSADGAPAGAPAPAPAVTTAAGQKPAPGPFHTNAAAAAAASAFNATWLAGPDDVMDLAADPATDPAPQPRAAAPAAPAAPAMPVEPLLRASARRLVLAVIDGGNPTPQLAAQAGTAAALAGAHLACSGPSPAARAFRAAGGDGQVIAFLETSSVPATSPIDGSAPDLPLPCGTRAVRNAMLAHACDAGLLCAESPEAIADAKELLRAGRPLALATPSAGLRQALGAPPHLLHEGATLQDAVLRLLFSLAPGPSAID